jgi:hypothetical protein
MAVDESYVNQILVGVRKLSDVALIVHMSGFREDSAPFRALNLELARRLKRREQRVAWVAIGISATALAVSIVTAYVRVASP